MSERRQLALLLAGLVVLTAIGIVGATLFPEPCEEFEQLGDLSLRFTDAVDALPLSPADGAAVEALGQDLGIGPWRGAVALPDDASVSRSEFGFFVVTTDDYVVLRPSIGIASASRGRAGLDAIPAGTNLLLRADDGETAVINGEYEVDRCGVLPPTAEVYAVDRGFALVGDEADVTLVTLSGDTVWSRAGVDAAHLVDDVALVGDEGRVELLDLRTGDLLDTTDASPGDRTPWLAAEGERVVVVGDGESVEVVTVEDDRLVRGQPVPVAGRLAVLTPGGIVAAASSDEGDVLATDRGTSAPPLPGLQVSNLLVSEDGHVGVLLRAATGERALAVYGPDR